MKTCSHCQLDFSAQDWAFPGCGSMPGQIGGFISLAPAIAGGGGGFPRLDWLARHFESLIDRPRTGAPQRISPEQLSKVPDAARSEPLTAKALLAKHVEDSGALVHLNTLKGALTAAGFVWKRTRHSLKKKERG